MKNFKKTAKRIKDAIKKGEKIILFADADLDGVASAIMLERVIISIGGEVKIFVSNREKWDYGLSKKAVTEIKKYSPALLVTLDCGVGNIEGVRKAKENGFAVIIIDHHKVIDSLPSADIVLDPHQKGDRYPFKKLANAGIVYKLSQEILGRRFDNYKKEFLELTTLASVADMVPYEKDNKEIMDEGKRELESPANKALLIIKEGSGAVDYIEKAVAMLNISEARRNVNDTYLFLTERDEKKLIGLFRRLERKKEERREQFKEEEGKLIKEVREDDFFILWGGFFTENLSGKLAGRLMQNYKKSVFLYVKNGNKRVGSVRTVKDDDAIDIMNYCKDYLDSYGGHKEAAGFVLKEKNVDKFREKLREYYSNIRK